MPYQTKQEQGSLLSFDNKSLEELRPLSIRVKTFQERVLDRIKLIVNKLGIFNIAKKIYKSIK